MRWVDTIPEEIWSELDIAYKQDLILLGRSIDNVIRINREIKEQKLRINVV
ncbi:hypothetical protein LCGC14_0589220 [marine sediment metagenome]|uniref:Uncharacterized protein n=1 Tax=marine sediment metagenome TaxID=412755 RepID=A0A0F9RE56_9ZZZZ